MQTSGRTILVGEDELEVRGYLQMALQCLGYSVELAQDGDEVLSYLQACQEDVQAILLDTMMPKRNGAETLRHIREIDPTLPVIVMSAATSPTDIVAAMKSGATDFISKPVSHEDLRKALARALNGDDGIHGSRKAAFSTPSMFLGTDPRMREIQVLMGQIGASEAPVLIQGETGSGKEVLARELMEQSPRAKRPFLKLNCAALPSELVESELFGYERGAFTGAFQKKAGMFENADGGTILLDEIGDMEFRLQAKLLQVLQDNSFHRIGGREVINVDVRVMAATHRDLEKAITDRTFREDLFYRLNVINIYLPPLRERAEDIVPMAEFLLNKHASNGPAPPPLTPELKEAIKGYYWPGNIRELENYMRKFLILKDADAIAYELKSKTHRKLVVAATATGGSAVLQHSSAGAPPSLEHVVKAKLRAETDLILSALDSAKWNRKRAAAILKVDYKALLYKMKKLGIESTPSGNIPRP